MCVSGQTDLFWQLIITQTQMAFFERSKCSVGWRVEDWVVLLLEDTEPGEDQLWPVLVVERRKVKALHLVCNHLWHPFGVRKTCCTLRCSLRASMCSR
jgi:hypothetical protein